MRKVRNLFMLGLLTVMVGLFVPACILEGDSYVRFTWEAAENSNITHISASVEDMEWWYSEIYADLGNSDADFTATPLKDGNPSVTGSIFEFGSKSNYHPNKGRYWMTDAGSFTAVCGVEDNYGLAEIVANYKITVDDINGEDQYFEIAFDVGTFLSDDGTDDNAWFIGKYDNPNDGPMLSKIGPKVGIKKVAQKQYKKSGATMDVTYYVIRRPNK
jgi:hypothetical protein